MSEVEDIDGNDADVDSKRVHIPRPGRYWMATAELFPGMIAPLLERLPSA